MDRQCAGGRGGIGHRWARLNKAGVARAGRARQGSDWSGRKWLEKDGQGRLGAERYVREMFGTSIRGKAG